MKNIIYTTLFAVLLLSCSTNNPATIAAPINITPTLLLKGELYGAGQENILEQRTVIDNQTDFDNLQTQMSMVNNTLFPPTIAVNFATEKVIAVFSPVQNSGGHAINISNIVETNTEITVTVTSTSPQGFATTVITQPYHVVKIPQTNKPIVFN